MYGFYNKGFFFLFVANHFGSRIAQESTIFAKIGNRTKMVIYLEHFFEINLYYFKICVLNVFKVSGKIVIENLGGHPP